MQQTSGEGRRALAGAAVVVVASLTGREEETAEKPTEAQQNTCECVTVCAQRV